MPNDFATQPVVSDPLGGLGDDTGTASTTRSPETDATRELRPSTVDPGLRGTVVVEQAVPGFGVDQGRAEPPGEDDPFGRPLLTPLHNDILDIDPAEDPLGLRVRQLDPFIPLGTRIGSFLIFAEVEIGGFFTDNVLATPTARSDYGFEFASEARLESDWARHAFVAEFTADRSWHNTFSVEDDKVYAAILRGRIDVGAHTHLGLELGRAQTQEGRNATSITNIGGIGTTVQEEQISAAATYNFHRLTVEVEGSISTFYYEDLTGIQLVIADAAVGQAIPQADVRDYRENELTMRGTYEFNPDLSLNVEGKLAEDFYEQPVTTTGLTRDSTGFAVIAGTTFAFSDAFYGDISVGWGE